MRRKNTKVVLAASVMLVTSGQAMAVLDHDNTPWMYMANGSDYPGYQNAHIDNEVVDGDGTKINGWAYYGGSDWGADNPAVKWDLDTRGASTPAPGIISYDLANGPIGDGEFARIATGRNGRGLAGATDWTPATGFTAEWSLATYYPGNDQGGHVWVSVNTGLSGGAKYAFQLIVADTPPLDPAGADDFHQITDRRYPGGGRAIAVPFDTRDGLLHKYRLVLEPNATPGSSALADLYIDDVFIDTVYGEAASSDMSLLFGRVAGGSYFNLIDADWDYVRIHPGATVPPLVNQWDLTGSGDWNVGGNWTVAVPDGVDAVANFWGAITAPSTVSTSTSVKAGQVSFDNATNSYTLGGSGSLTLETSSGSALVVVVEGSHEIALPVGLASNTTFTVAPAASTLTVSGALTATGVNVTKTGAGTLEVANIRATGLSVNAGKVVVLEDGTDAGTSRATGSFFVSNIATLDLTDNDLIVDGGDYSAIQARVIQGFNNGNWMGAGITSSAAATDTNFVTALGVVNNADIDYSEFSGQTGLDGDEILVKYTYYGDADLGGTVNLDDFNQFLFGFNPANAAPPIWLNGDFDYNGSINLDDFNQFLFGLANQGGTLVSPELFAALSQFVAAEGIDTDLSAVPEPAGMSLLGLAAVLMQRRRARRNARTARSLRI